NFTFTASQFLGFLILGPLLVKIVAANNEFGPIYIVMAALFALCTLLTWLLPKGEKIRPSMDADLNGDGVITLRERVTSTANELREGWEYIKADRAIFGAIIQWSVAIGVVLMRGVVGPGVIQCELNLDPQELYIILRPGELGLLDVVVLVVRVARMQNLLGMI